MRVLSILFLSFLITLNVALAQVIQSEFIPSQEMGQVKEGDIIEAIIRIWPIENADLGQFKKLEKTVLFNSLYMAQITNLGVSQNNADVVELKGLFIVQSAKIQPFYSFKYNDSTIELRPQGLSVHELKNQSQDFYILDQSLNKSMIWMIVVGVLLVLIVVAIIKRNAIKAYFIGLRPGSLKKSRQKYDELFRRADKREDFETLYKDRDVWMGLLTDKAPAHFEFLKTLNQHQFKKEWGSSDYEEVKSSFDIIRRSFEK